MPVLLLIFSTGMAGAQSPSAPDIMSAPDIEIVAFALATGQTSMGFSYAHAVPHAQAERDLQALATASGWHPQHVKITDSLPPVSGATQKLTAVEFTVLGGIDPKAGTLAVQPFVQAFQTYPHIAITYVADPSFHFRGLRDYQDAHVQVKLKQQGSTYTYQILLTGSGGPGLTLSVPETQSQVTAAAAPHTSPWIIVLIVLAAAGTGLLVYLSVARAGQPKNMKLNVKGKKHAGTP